MKQKEQLKLLRWAEDGFPPIDLNADFRAVIDLIHAYNKLKNQKRKTKEPHPAFTELVKIWFEELHPTHCFNSEDGRAINGMIKNMTDYCAKKWDGERIADVEYLKTFFKHFCTHLPEFYQSETLPTLNRKFYAIIEQITKGGGTKKSTRPGSVSETQLWAASLQTTD